MSYGFGTTWGWLINDRIFIFGLTIPLKYGLYYRANKFSLIHSQHNFTIPKSEKKFHKNFETWNWKLRSYLYIDWWIYHKQALKMNEELTPTSLFLVFYFPGFWFLVFYFPGFWFLVFYSAGFWFLVFYSPGFWFLVFYSAGFWFLVFYSAGFWFLVFYSPGFCFLLFYSPGFWFLLIYSPGFWFLLF